MSAQEIKTASQPETPLAQERRSYRSGIWLLIGLMTIVIATVTLLSLSNSDSGISMTQGSLVVFAPAAFLAGVLSFLSPCTLPILPAYFAFTFQARRERIFLMTIAFFFGLATTMILLGASATAISRLLFQHLQTLTLIGGWIVIGLGVMSVLGKGFGGMQILDRPSASITGSYLYGATFALGWTACVGPILGGLLTMLTTQGIAVLEGALLAFIYATGLGTPLILVAAFFNRLGSNSRIWQIMRGRGYTVSLGKITLYLHSTSIISGLMLIGVGALMASGQLATINAWGQSTGVAKWASDLEWVIYNFFIGR